MHDLRIAEQVSDFLEEGHYDPHHILGLHSAGDQAKVIRIWRPGAESLHLEVFGKIQEAKKVDSRGLFEFLTSASTSFTDYRIFDYSGNLSFDPYSFLPSFGELDAYLFSKGVHYQLFDVMGGRVAVHQGVQGVKFAVWAPEAKSVALVADFNFWDGRLNPMRSMGKSGVWELFVPSLQPLQRYKFEVKSKSGRLCLKADPYAYFSELRPATASVVFDVDQFTWNDHEWLDLRKKQKDQSFPLNIYEVHLGSWKKNQGHFLNYRELAHDLVDYCLKMGFTHVELMPVAEHPLDESWGYQVTGFYAVTARYGTPQDFQYFVDYLHQNHIGVILDWVPAHFPMDDFSLAKFDGSYLYEHEDPKKGFHPHWNTNIFNYGRHEVSNFLIANALFWLGKMHIDGLRVDAVASMLYLDYGRLEGEWIPNQYGGKENIEAIEFIKHLNSVVHEQFPGILMFAEESTSFTGVTHPLSYGGLGFDIKWNMGWMNDTLRYFHKDPLYRHYHQNELTFGLIYAFSEKFILVLSHDEVVHGKGNLIQKMPGDLWQRFANLRLLYSYMICQPGKKLLFMGGEIGQWDEWNCKDELQWFLLNFPMHQNLQKFVGQMNGFYRSQPPLWQYDFEGRGFEWIDFSDHKNSVISYLRKADHKYLVCVHNFTPAFLPEYFIALRNVKSVFEVFNTDREEFGGSNKINQHISVIKDGHDKHVGFIISLAPLASMIFEVEFLNS